MNEEEWEAARGWRGNMRSDGVQIIRGESGGYLVRLPNGGATILTCPCCGKRLATARAAKLAADHVYPGAFNQ